MTACDGEVSVYDRGFAYGDGVFETLPVASGRLPGLERHLSRLARGCSTLGFEVPGDAITSALAIAAAVPGRGVIKLVVTRGSGGRGYRPPEHPSPSVRVTRYDWPAEVERWRLEGIMAARLQARLGDVPALAGIKHLNRLEQVLAATELARQPAAGEGIVHDLRGQPICGVMSNLFLVSAGALLTARLHRCGVAGIIRETILELSCAGALPGVTERDLAAEDLDIADEVFFTNSIRGVVPVAWLDDRILGKPGPITRAVQRAVSEAGVVA